jgi:glyoxylase-like metal-dependent hydrolase (beta-lactamase superfamily II)/8-oxo-dGTP pyrophosphatase MutT (NUDIX family)
MERRAAHDPSPPVDPQPAATVVLVRPGADGLEVLLTRRPDAMSFAGGLHVFPGGRVEPTDADHRAAAIRETREEVGVALPETAELVEVARWVTPRAYPRRFDARFFVAELPPGAVVSADSREVVDHVWLTPRAALLARSRGDIAMWPPTSTTLQVLERAGSFDDVRSGLGRTFDLPIRVERIEPTLAVVTGRSAFGPAGRPTNTVLVGRREVVVVDPGDPDEDVLDAIEATVAAGGGRIVAIALTHVDPGHAAGSEDLNERTGAPILVGPGGAAPLCWVVTEIADGSVVGNGDGRLIAIVTPGHRPDHLAFLRGDGTLLIGDAVTDRPTLVLSPEGDPDAQRTTHARIAALIDEGTVRRLVPGHGPPIPADPAALLTAR